MRIVLVHDYLNEFGGAERVLLALSEIWLEAPIYTAFYKKDSPAYERFKDKKIITSWAQRIPGFNKYLFSPLRFLAPLIWNSFNFSDYDVILSSAGWYVTKGFRKGNQAIRKSGHQEIGPSGNQKPDNLTTRNPNNPIEICYCHTPPRWLYGYKTSIEWQRFWPIRIYGTIIGHFMRLYDFNAAQRVDYFIANSKEVQGRIKKFYRRDSMVIYPPISLGSYSLLAVRNSKSEKPASQAKRGERKANGGYYFVVARIVGGKGLSLAVEAAKRLKVKLKIAGMPAGYKMEYRNLIKEAASNVEFLGYVKDSELVELYSNAKAFLALAQEEDFGITPVEAMSFGTPVVAYYGGGYKETVIEGKTGVFFKDYSIESLMEAIKKLETLNISPDTCKKQAEKFSKQQFKHQIAKFVESKLRQVGTKPTLTL